MAADGDRPEPALTLLLQACLSPAPKALAAWREWQGRRPFEAISGAEVRLLAPLSPRLRTLDPGSPLLPRIAGIARARWTMAQLVLRAGGEAVGLLADAGMPLLVFGAAATHADDVGAHARREIDVVDLLIPAGRLAEAAARLSRDGWHAADGASTALLHEAASSRNRVRFLRGAHGDVALWKVPFARCRDDAGAIDALWRHAVPAAMGDRSILAPHPTEAVQRARRQPVDWGRLVDASRRWRLSPVAGRRLRLLVEDLDLAIEPAFLRRLAEDRPTFAEWVGSRAAPGGPAARWARRMLARRGHILPPDDAPGVPAFRARRAAGRPAAGDFSHHQAVGPGGGRILLGFPAEAAGRAFRIEASRDGLAIALVRGRVGAALHAVTLRGPPVLESRPLAVERAGFGALPAAAEDPVAFRAWRG